MNKLIFLIALGIVALCTMTPVVSAAEILVESNQLIVKGFDDSIGLGAFSVVIGYDPVKTTVTDVTFTDPFAGATNIQPDEKTIRISGFTVQSQLTGNIPIARIVYEGEEQFDVYVDTLVNSKGDDISPINPAYDKERSPVSSSTKPNTDSTQEPTGVTQTVATATASQTLSPQATGTIPLSSGDTPTASVHQNTDDFSSSDSFESAPVDTVGPGTSVQTQATKSPLIPILVVLAFAVALVGLRKCA